MPTFEPGLFTRLVRLAIAGAISAIVYELVSLMAPQSFEDSLNLISMSHVPGVLANFIFNPFMESNPFAAPGSVIVHSTSILFWFCVGAASAYLGKKNWVAIVIWVGLVISIELLGTALFLFLELMRYWSLEEERGNLD